MHTLPETGCSEGGVHEGSGEIRFHLARGGYYGAVGFSDAVYRVYRMLLSNPDIVPDRSLILIDEFQDFNRLEVAFLDELEKRGPILIVGDDDQAVYNSRSATPIYLRRKWSSGEYERFELPYCSRCTEAVVGTANEIVAKAQRKGYLAGRIPKRFECYLPDKGADSEEFPAILCVECTTPKVIARYVRREIGRIKGEDIVASRSDGYPTVLVVGDRHYLRVLHKELVPHFSQVSFSPSKEASYGTAEAYEELLEDEHSNLGWRVLMERFLDAHRQKEVLTATQHGAPLRSLLEEAFVERHLRVLQAIRVIREGCACAPEVIACLRDVLGKECNAVRGHFTPPAVPEAAPEDDSEPTITLTSFVGCKGLSAAHVFIVGAHNGCIPRNPNSVSDVEICQFLVALTRTRKQCHIIFSGRGLSSGQKKPPEQYRSMFVSWIPPKLLRRIGPLKASDLR
jgi:hypothetical protein